MERLDLAGMDFIWRIAMETPDEEIANEAIQLIITYSYTNLNPKMKKVCVCVVCERAHVSHCPRTTVSLKMLPSEGRDRLSDKEPNYIVKLENRKSTNITGPLQHYHTSKSVSHFLKLDINNGN